MMNNVILASHGGLAAGVLDTLSMVLGQVDNIHVVSLARDEKEPITDKVRSLIDSFAEDDAIYILTDMLGSSVNNSMVELMHTDSRLTVISGMNMPLVLGLAIAPGPIRDADLVSLIHESRLGLRNCADDGRDEHPRGSSLEPHGPKKSQTRNGRTKISLVRLDYRLLHGQVVFSWVNSIGAQRIIVVDDETAADDVKKGVLKLAKPSGVRLNIFSVERALAKMEKLESLGENVMMIFGNTHELLKFCRSYQKLTEINYGATANKDGARQYGGSGGSVFLDDAEQQDTRQLLELGLKIYVQQVPTLAREDITCV